MPSIVLRHASDTDRLIRAVQSLGYQFDRKWSPGDRRARSPNHENFGFNLCLVDQENLPVGECLEEALQQVDQLERELSAVGQSLRGCSIDIGLFEHPDYFTRCARLSAEQCARLGNLGVDFEATFYPSAQPDS